MKSLKKWMLLPLALVLTAGMMLTGCEKTAAEEEAENVEEINDESLAAVESFSEKMFVNGIFTLPSKQFDQAVASGQIVFNPAFDQDLRNRWNTFSEKHGEVNANASRVIDTVKNGKNGYESRLALTGEDGEVMTLTVRYNDSLQPISTLLEDYHDDSSLPTGERMKTAGANIVVGLGTVFLVLVLLTLLIASFGLLGKGKKAPVPERKQPVAAVSKPALAVVTEPDEGELIAVISAAVAAAQETPADGFVVRSIRRLPSNKWR